MGSRTEVEIMTEEEIIKQERDCTGTSWTYSEFFDENGYLILKKLCDPEKLYHPFPKERGCYEWYGKKLDDYVYHKVETQVEGSLSRYWHPQYQHTHTKIRKILEEIINRKLYNTYYYDRFYFPGQELTRHLDRPSCEISVSVHVSTNLETSWPIYVKTPDKYTDNLKTNIEKEGEIVPVILEKGDALLYKGCERPHWRNPMPGSFSKLNGIDNLYYHQIFFHYVLQDGVRAHYAWDRLK